MGAWIVDAMRDPAVYGRGVGSVEVVETHISWVFLAGDRAYKVKKPVRLPFLDYRSPAARLRFCREEVRLNRRLAPDVYLGVRAIVPSGHRHVALADKGAPGALDYAVEMRRYDPGRTLAQRVATGDAGAAEIAAVARRIAAFHAGARVAPADPTAFAAELRDTMSTILALAPPARRPMLEPLSARLDELARVLAPELAQRAAAGLVRDCHGDLRAEHVLLDGQVQICDCIEFDARLRAIDTGCDLAFLTMDLERLGAHPLAERLVALYRGAGGDPGSQRLRTLFAAYRALVRAKVALLRAGQLAGPAAAERRCEAESYMRLAWRFVWRTHEPIVIALCGPAGSGKSTLARELARTTGLPRISSDVTRKAMAGLAPRERGPAALYSDAMTARVYRELGRGAAEALAGDGAIVDATFRHARDRIAFCDELHAAAPVFVRCVAPPEIVLERVRRRTTGLETESDAGPEVAAHQLEDFEPLDDLPAGAWVEVSTDRPPALVAAEVEAMLAGSAAIAAVR